MSSFNEYSTPAGFEQGVIGASSRATSIETLAHLNKLPDGVINGKVCGILLPKYEPKTDLLYYNPDDDPATTEIDESKILPKESWLKEDRPYLVNIGGHRIALPNEILTFDATQSQGDMDEIALAAHWNFGDGNEADGLQVQHEYDTPGLYIVTCTINGTSGKRYVRVLNNYGESDIDVIDISQWSASETSGWSVTANVIGKIDLKEYQGILFYLDDGVDRAWRRVYDNNIRSLSRRTAYTSAQAPEPIWDISTVTIGSETAIKSTSPTTSVPPLGDPTGPVWDEINKHDQYFLKYGDLSRVPPNLLKALVYKESRGVVNKRTKTENTQCPNAFGLFQIAPGCSSAVIPLEENELLQARTNIKAGAEEMATHYKNCGKWGNAINAFFSGECESSGLVDDQGTTDYEYVAAIKNLWREADAHNPNIIEDTTQGRVIFSGYVESQQTITTADGDQTQINLISALGMLQHLQIRQEIFFENAEQGKYGGVVTGRPLRTAVAIHHILTEHTNFATWHDIILDWSGPRYWSTTAQEGSMGSALSAWAANDFSAATTRTNGTLRYTYKPSYRGESYYEQAKNYALWVDPTLIMAVKAADRRVGNRTVWAKVCGMTSNGQCEICQTYPCGNPRAGLGGKWDVVRGLQYDDYRVLCQMAAHHYAYVNRRWDVEITLPWQPDLEVHDLLRLPLRDPDGRFNWAGDNAPFFTITGISHAFSVAEQSFISTVTCEEVTFGIPCDCPRPHCPKTIRNEGKDDDGFGDGTNFENWDTGWVGNNCGVYMGPVSYYYEWLTDFVQTYGGGQPGGLPSPIDSWQELRHVDPSVTNIIDDYGLGTYPGTNVPIVNDWVTIGLGTGDDAIAELYKKGSDIGDGIYVFFNQSFGASDTLEDRPRIGIINRTTHTVNADEVYMYADFKIFGPEKSFLIGDLNFRVSYNALFKRPSSPDGIKRMDTGDTKAEIRLYKLLPENTALGLDAINPPANLPDPMRPAVRYGDSVLNTETYTVIGTVSGEESLTGFISTDLLNNHKPFEVKLEGSPQGVAYRIGVYPTFVPWRSNAKSSYESIQYDAFWVDTESEDIHYTFSNDIEIIIDPVWRKCQIGEEDPIPFGDGDYPGWDGTIPFGVCAGWPSADKINARIQSSSNANGRNSPLLNSGAAFLQLGKQYGINPGVVCAILQRESQLASDGSFLPTQFNNFGGITGTGGTCGSGFFLDRVWQKFCTPQDGLEAVFKTLDGSIYRNTGGRFVDIMNLYSPSFENDWPAMWKTFEAVGNQLGITLNAGINIYAEADCQDTGIPSPSSGPGYGGYTTMLEWVCHQCKMGISQGPFGIWSHSVCDCYDFGMPIGTPLYSIAPGKVIISESTSGVYTPNTIVIRTAWGDIRYAHLTQRSVQVGDEIKLDTLLGYSGTAGTGPHLHLGLEGGSGNSPVHYNLTQILQAVGFNIGRFTR